MFQSILKTGYLLRCQNINRHISAISTSVTQGGLTINSQLFDTVYKILDGTDISEEEFWKGFENTIIDLIPENTSLLKKRDELQKELDKYYKSNSNPQVDMMKYKSFLTKIGYLLPRVENFHINDINVDEEITDINGPQLVVPIDNKRKVINAVNARWGSLYYAFFNTNALYPKQDVVNREERIVFALYDVLEKYYPLESVINKSEYIETSSENMEPLIEYRYENIESCIITDKGKLKFIFENGSTCKLLHDDNTFIGYTGESYKNPKSILLKHHGLHMELILASKHHNETNEIKKHVWLKDIVVESALTTICDFEDSVASVDGSDKSVGYMNWLGLMKGDLNIHLQNGSHGEMSLDKTFHYPPNNMPHKDFTLKGRSILMVRNVGLHMKTNSVQYNHEDIPEGILDAFVTTAAGIHSLKKTSSSSSELSNSRHGSLYIIKPKIHSPDEIKYIMKLFDFVEKVLKLPSNTIKLGIMDEERRMSLNLKACLKEAQNRLVYMNTDFLDRVGDEIHSIKNSGPVLPKSLMSKSKFYEKYEEQNVYIGLKIASFIDQTSYDLKLNNHLQIGKGMWYESDDMFSLLKHKHVDLLTGANTSWVSSPQAAVIHALHYHDFNVNLVQKTLIKKCNFFNDDDEKEGLDREALYVDGLLQAPLLLDFELSQQEIQTELDLNIHVILSYVVKYVNQGIGSSKVHSFESSHDTPYKFIHEDRATLRLSSQFISNWLLHNVISKKDVYKSLKKMSQLVDEQNKGSLGYTPMGIDPLKTSTAFNAAVDLIFIPTPNGYMEETLNLRRRQVKENGPLRGPLTLDNVSEHTK